MNANNNNQHGTTIEIGQIIDHEAALRGHKHCEEAISEYLKNHIEAYRQIRDRMEQQGDLSARDFYDGCVYALQTMRDYHQLQALIFTQFMNGIR